MEESRVCSKCKIEKTLTIEFFGPQQKNKARLHTECRECKLKYMKQWQANKRAEQDCNKPNYARHLCRMHYDKSIRKERRKKK